MKGANFSGDRKLIWLASYPKSGSTWLRSLLSAYLLSEEEFALNSLLGSQHVFDRQILDDHAGIDSAIMLPVELLPYQAQLHRDVAQQSAIRQFIKTHSAFVHAGNGEALFPSSVSAGAIVIVRNPLDIVPSYAHHEGRNADWVIDRMRNEETTSDTWPTKSGLMLPQRLSSWSENVRSWLDQPDIPVLLLRYEDMHSDPEAALTAALSFCEVEVDTVRVSRSVERCSFKQLRAHETQVGFAERPFADRTFFRSGRTGDGARTLSNSQLSGVVQDHNAVMQRLGYSISPDEYIATKPADL